MSRIPFYKINGSGNDFILIDNMNGSVSETPATLAKKLCARKFSVGADGLIMLEPSKTLDFKWRFHNADGSEAEMCGNGARCAARFAVIRGIAGNELSFETVAGQINATVTGKSVKITMTDPFDLKISTPLLINEKNSVVSFINTGVPHAVKVINDIEKVDVCGEGKKIRYHEHFAPAGTNVNFAQVMSEHSISIRTYERGVEDETLACGTGAVAAAIITSLDGKVHSPVIVFTKGGEKLTISFSRQDDEFKEVCMEGDTAVVYSGEALREALE